MTWEDILNAVEPALSYVHLANKHSDESHQVFAALDSCERFLRIFLPPQIKAFRLVQLRDLLQREADTRWSLLDWEDVECRGDLLQISLLLGSVLNAARLEKDAVIQISAVRKNDIPRIVLSFDGPGCFPGSLPLGAAISLGFGDLEERWTSATRGGGITRTPYRVELRLVGQRPIPDSFQQVSRIVGHVEEIRRALKEGSSDSNEGLKRLEGLLQSCLEIVQPDDSSMTPLDVIASAKKAFDDIREARVLSNQLCEFRPLASIPPLLVPRGLFHLFWKNAARLVAESADPGGTVVFVSYNTETRAVNIRFCFAVVEASLSVRCLIASLGRVVGAMEGRVTLAWDGGKLQSMEVDLNDAIGVRLDVKLPGWEHFTSKSKQLLRMLEGLPGEQSHEALRGSVLKGVLEEELEQNLLPSLSLPQVVNYAFDLSEIEAFGGMTRENMGKLLSQVRRRKPKKELARPTYAAAAYWLFRKCPAFRERTGIEELSTDDIRAFCQILMEPAPDYYQALRYLARMKASSRDGSDKIPSN